MRRKTGSRSCPVGAVALIAPAVVVTSACGAGSSTPEARTAVPPSGTSATAVEAEPSADPAPCPGTLTLKVDEVITGATPGGFAGGRGFDGSSRIPCRERRGCRFGVEVPDPSRYPPEHEHRIPVGATRSVPADPGRECHSSKATS